MAETAEGEVQKVATAVKSEPCHDLGGKSERLSNAKSPAGKAASEAAKEDGCALNGVDGTVFEGQAGECVEDAYYPAGEEAYYQPEGIILSPWTSTAVASLYCDVCQRAFSSEQGVLQHLRDAWRHQGAMEQAEAIQALAIQEQYEMAAAAWQQGEGMEGGSGDAAAAGYSDANGYWYPMYPYTFDDACYSQQEGGCYSQGTCEQQCTQQSDVASPSQASCNAVESPAPSALSAPEQQMQQKQASVPPSNNKQAKQKQSGKGQGQKEQQSKAAVASASHKPTRKAADSKPDAPAKANGQTPSNGQQQQQQSRHRNGGGRSNGGAKRAPAAPPAAPQDYDAAFPPLNDKAPAPSLRKWTPALATRKLRVDAPTFQPKAATAAASADGVEMVPSGTAAVEDVAAGLPNVAVTKQPQEQQQEADQQQQQQEADQQHLQQQAQLRPEAPLFVPVSPSTARSVCSSTSDVSVSTTSSGAEHHDQEHKLPGAAAATAVDTASSKASCMLAAAVAPAVPLVAVGAGDLAGADGGLCTQRSLHSHPVMADDSFGSDMSDEE